MRLGGGRGGGGGGGREEKGCKPNCSSDRKKNKGKPDKMGKCESDEVIRGSSGLQWGTIDWFQFRKVGV